MTKRLPLGSYLFRLRRVEEALKRGETASWHFVVGVLAFLLSLVAGYLFAGEPATSPALARLWPWVEALTILAGTMLTIMAGGISNATRAWVVLPVVFVPVVVRLILFAVIAYPVLFFGLAWLFDSVVSESGMKYLFSLSQTSVFDLCFEELILIVQYFLLYRSVGRVLAKSG